MEQRNFTYRAFISFSHKDQAFALELLHQLERYQVPRALRRKCPQLPARLVPIFLDSPSIGHLPPGEMRMQALEESRHLIVITSEAAVRAMELHRDWVNGDIDHFLRLHPDNIRRIIPIMLRKDESTPALNCLLPALREHNILAADVLVNGKKRVFHDVVTRLLELPPELLWVHVTPRRRGGMRWLAAAALIALGAAALWWHCCG